MSDTMQGNIRKAKTASEAEPEYAVHTAQPSQAELDYEAYQQEQAEYFGSLPNDVQDALLQYGSPEYDPQAIAAIQRKLTKEELEIKELLKRFKTVKDLFASGVQETKWLVSCFIPEQALVSFQGRAKSGKSTLVFAMLKALVSGGEFLGEVIPQTKVVYLSEQPREIFKGQLAEAGIDRETENLAALTVEDNHGLNWDKTFQFAQAKLIEMGAKLLIIDSWGRFAQFGLGEDEMAPAPTQRRVTSLRSLMANTGATVFIVQHVSKDHSRGLIDSGMGSSALAQQVDLALSLSGEPPRTEIRANRLQNENCRAIQGVGRFPLHKPIAVERKDGRFALSTFKEDDGTEADAETMLIELLANGPVDSQAVYDKADSLRIGKRALAAAKQSLHIKPRKVGKGWEWRYLDEAENKEDEQESQRMFTTFGAK